MVVRIYVRTTIRTPLMERRALIVTLRGHPTSGQRVL
jgi:hypothetical protein